MLTLLPTVYFSKIDYYRLAVIMYLLVRFVINLIFGLDSSCQDTLSAALDAVLEKTQDFTDSAYTGHEHRQAILDSCDRLKAELDHLLGLYANVVSSSAILFGDIHLKMNFV